MRILVFLALLGSLVNGASADREKVEEGQYAILRNNALVRGSEHSWILWRLPDGRLELEDHFQPSQTLRAIWASLLSPGMPISPELRESLERGIEPSDLLATLDPERRILSLAVKGVKVNGDHGVGLECKTSSGAIEYTGTSGKTKLRLHEPRELFWWHGIPMLLQS